MIGDAMHRASLPPHWIPENHRVIRQSKVELEREACMMVIAESESELMLWQIAAFVGWGIAIILVILTWNKS